MKPLSLLAFIISLRILPVRTDIKIHYGKSIVIIRSVEASFGEGLPFGGLFGRLRIGEPLDGCSPILPPPEKKHSKESHWFVLLERSNNCTFQDKVSAATSANYSAAIIFNNLNDRIFHMGGEGPGLIPSVLVGKNDGHLLLNNYTGPNITLVIFPDEPFDLNVYLLPFAIVIGICFLLMLGIVIFKCVQDHRRNARHRLPKSALKNLPIIRFVSESSPYDTCCICLDDYAQGDKLRVLPCDHAYHKACIDPWLVKNRRICPQCRKKVFGREQEEEMYNEEGSGAEWDSLLANARSTVRNSGTFQAEGTYAAARADQLSSSGIGSGTRSLVARFNLFSSRYRRLEEPYIDNSEEAAAPASDTPEEMEEEDGEVHVAIVHSQADQGEENII